MRTLSRLTALALLTGIGLVAAELIAGFLVDDSGVTSAPMPAGDAVSTTLQRLNANPVPLEPDRRLLWRNRPDSRKTQPVNPRHYGRDESWTLEVNSEGFRGAERTEPAHEVYRILCIGDSITYGFNVDDDATYPSQLEQLLRRRHPRLRLEVINAGVPGWSWVQGLRFLEDEGLSTEPDLVIAAHGTNDLFWQARVTDAEWMERLGNPWIHAVSFIRSHVGETNLFRLAGQLGKAPLPELSPSCAAQVARDGVCRRVPLDEIGGIVQRMRSVTDARGVDLALLNFDFLKNGSAVPLRVAAQRDGTLLLEFVAEFERLRREDDEDRARRLGLRHAGPLAAEPAVGNPPAAGRRVLFRVWAPRVQGDARVTVHIEGANGPPTGVPTTDDGRGGDERAGDRVYSALVDLPPQGSDVLYGYRVDGTPEFERLPPFGSSRGERQLRVEGAWVGPVDSLGDDHLMADRVHPDRAGHAVIAASIAGALAPRLAQ